jgi:hypothetical protein
MVNKKQTSLKMFYAISYSIIGSALDRLRFGQAPLWTAKRAPCSTLPSFSNELDWGASITIAELILRGDSLNDKLTNIKELLVDCCTCLSPLDDIPTEITVARRL